MASSTLIPQDLPINRDLLNPKFEGYKLSLEEIKIREIKLPGSGVLEVKLPDDQFSYQQIRAFSQLNALVLDRWNLNTVYWINKDLAVSGYHERGEENFQSNVFTTGHVPKQHASAGQINEFHVGLSFPDQLHAVIADGTGRLLLAHTPNRSTKPEEEWAFELVDYAGDKSAILVATNSWIGDSGPVFEVLLLSVEETPDRGDSDQTRLSTSHKEFRTVLQWLTVHRNLQTNSLLVDRTRVLHGKSVPNYTALEKQGGGLNICGDATFHFVSDTAKTVANDEEAMEEDSAVPEVVLPVEPEYTWLQTPSDLTVRIPAPMGLTKQQLQFKLTSSTIQLIHDGGKVLLDGALSSAVDTELSTWNVENGLVMVTLQKISPERWTEFIVGDDRGKEIFSLDELSAERFPGLTADKWLTQQDVNMTNPEQLEDCDSFPEDSACWTRIDGESHKISHKVDVSSNQFLFSALLNPDEQPALCLRTDVDGVLIQPCEPKSPADPAVRHVGTFSALGYVMASKRDKRFASCSPSMSFAALCDGDRNVYVYRSDVPIDSVLVHRKTGKVVKTVAKQHVLSLEKPGRILGFSANNSGVFILKADALLFASL